MTTLPRPLPLIDLERCSGCGQCVELCPTAAVALSQGRAEIVRPEDCTFCEICESFCPEGAIGRPFAIVFAPSVAPRPERTAIAHRPQDKDLRQ